MTQVIFQSRRDLITHVFCSLISLLKLGGLSKEEVSTLFQDAAAAMQGSIDSEFQDTISQHIIKYFDSDGVDEEEDIFSLEMITDSFQQSSVFKELSYTKKKFDAIDDGNGEDERYSAEKLDRLFPLLVELIQLRNQAFNFLKVECQKNNVSFVTNRSDWIKTASKDDFDSEDNILFFDDTYYIPEINQWIFEAIASSLSDKGDNQRLNDLREYIALLPDVFSFDAIQIIDNAIKDASVREQVCGWYLDYLKDHSDGIQRSYLIDAAATNFKQSDTKLLRWLEILVEKNLIEFTKRGGRWWVSLTRPL